MRRTERQTGLRVTKAEARLGKVRRLHDATYIRGGNPFVDSSAGPSGLLEYDLTEQRNKHNSFFEELHQSEREQLPWATYIFQRLSHSYAVIKDDIYTERLRQKALRNALMIRR